MKAHVYQQQRCQSGLKPILNAACKEDPARLGQQYGAVNLDIWTFDEQTKRDLKQLPNFVNGDVCNMEMFEDGRFGTIILGEFLEHCVPSIARKALKECHRVLSDDPQASLVLTLPLDGRPAGVQHGAHLLKVIVEGETGHDITVWHQTVWEDEMLDSLFEDTGFKVVSKDPMDYSFVRDRKPCGWGIVLKKKA